MAYCLDGSAMDISTGEVLRKSPPCIGYITFYENKIIIDNVETYMLWQEQNGVKAFQGQTLSLYGGEATPVIFVDPHYSDVVLFITMSNTNSILKAPIYLMDVAKFQALLSRHSGISNDIFMNNADNASNHSTKTNSNSGSKSYYSSRYGYKDCHVCHGLKKCNTCNGKGWIRHTMTGTTGDCPNCTDGKCSICGGTGKVYGAK